MTWIAIGCFVIIGISIPIIVLCLRKTEVFKSNSQDRSKSTSPFFNGRKQFDSVDDYLTQYTPPAGIPIMEQRRFGRKRYRSNPGIQIKTPQSSQVPKPKT